MFMGLLGWMVTAQERPIFMAFDESRQAAYQQEQAQLDQQDLSPLAYVDQKIYIASSYKQLDDLIAALEEKITLTSENAALCYYLGGVNGMKALSVYRLFALPYVRAMLNNFKRSLQLDPTYTPAIEAYIEALCLVPAIIGGSVEKANELSAQLIELSLVEGYFSKGFIAKHLRKDKEAIKAYSRAFDQLEDIGFCQLDPTVFFENKSLNFSYKIAEVSAHYTLSPAIGLCAIDYFIAQATPLYTIPLEWAYYRKAQLQLKLGQVAEAALSLKKALAINPSFELAKTIEYPLIIKDE